jgi:hypothetical protein
VSLEIKKSNLTPEQQAVADLSEGAEAVFDAHSTELNDLSKSRTVHVSGLYLTERQDGNGSSEFSVWSAWHSDQDKGEHLYGKWEKGGSETIADTSDDSRDRTPLDMDGLAKLKVMIDTSFPVPEKVEVKSVGLLRRSLGSIATHRERSRLRRQVFHELKQQRKKT